MSRVRTFLVGRRRIALGRGTAVAGAALGAALLLGGCGAGQIAQTDTIQSAVNGATANIGQVALRDVQLAYPPGSQNYYPSGASAKVILTAVNHGTEDDQLVAVSSPWFSGNSITGNKSLPAGTSLTSGTDPDDAPAAPSASTAPSSTAPSASATPGPVGTVVITLTGLNKNALRPGITVPVTFQFAVGGTATVQVPIGAPGDHAAQ